MNNIGCKVVSLRQHRNAREADKLCDSLLRRLPSLVSREAAYGFRHRVRQALLLEEGTPEHKDFIEAMDDLEREVMTVLERKSRQSVLA